MPQAQPRVDEKAVEDAAPSAPQIDALTPPQSNADDVTGSLAGFFAQDEKSIRDAEALIDQMEDDDAPTVSIKPRMSVLELGKSDEYVGETETDNDAGASEPSTEHAAAPEATSEDDDVMADAPDLADLSVSEADPVSEQPVAATRHTANTARPPEETASEPAAAGRARRAGHVCARTGRGPGRAHPCRGRPGGTCARSPTAAQLCPFRGHAG